MTKYDNLFFDEQEAISRIAAEKILPKVISLLKPKSIIDFGCGRGLWLSIAKEIDENIEVFGIDGDWVDKSELKVAAESFEAADLTKEFLSNKRYDLAMSFEVAEHLDEKYADVFIDNMTRLSDNILFGAALPGQGGTGHVNEQWQSYWIEKFVQRGYTVDLSIRNLFWNDTEIPSWRRTTILYFTKENSTPIASGEIYDVVHPELFAYRNISVKSVYNSLDMQIRQFVEAGKTNIVIYPFGETGYIGKEILNHKYKIKEQAIIDNKLCHTTEGIYDCSYLAELKDEFVVLETCNNPRIHNEVLECLKSVLDDRIEVVSVFNN